MASGIIYCMTTIVDGLVKIGKTGKDNFEQRMYNLEHNGYVNITGLKREFAIEVEDYDEKEQLIHNIFSKSNVQGTELFAIDKGLVIQLLSSFDGKQVYPKDISKEEVFDIATDEVDTEAQEKAENFSFAKCWIEPGSVLTFINDPSKTCIVVNDRKVEFNGKEMYLTGVAKILLGKKSGIAGPKYFKYNNEILSDIRHRLNV